VASFELLFSRSFWFELTDQFLPFWNWFLNHFSKRSSRDESTLTTCALEYSLYSTCAPPITKPIELAPDDDSNPITPDADAVLPQRETAAVSQDLRPELRPRKATEEKALPLGRSRG
jgi:hypothetical protein